MALACRLGRQAEDYRRDSEAAPIYTYESPELFTPQSAVDSNLNGDSARIAP